MNLSVITITYQSQNYIENCILSVMTHVKDPSYEHIIIDNGSTDETIEIIEKNHANFVRLIKNTKNRGFAAASQQAVQEAQGRYLLFLNPDMEIHEGRIDDLLFWMDQNKEAGIASCKLLSYLKQPHPILRPSKFPTLFPYFLSFLKWSPFFCSVNPRFFFSNFDDDQVQEVDLVRGAFVLIKRETAQKLGAVFDPGYFILFEDIDLCKNVQRLKLKIFYWPHLSCIDYFGRSFLEKSVPWKYLQMQRSFKRYVRKWHSPLHLLWIYPLAPLGFLLRIREWGWKLSWQALKELAVKSF